MPASSVGRRADSERVVSFSRGLLAGFATLLLLAAPALAAAAPRLDAATARGLIEADGRAVNVGNAHPTARWTVTHEDRGDAWVGRLRSPGSSLDIAVATVRDSDRKVTAVDNLEAKRRRLPEAEATAIAEGSAKVQDWLRRYRDEGRKVTSATRWENDLWVRHWWSDGAEIAQVKVDSEQRSVRSAWIGPQVAWSMARGNRGSFGRRINDPEILFPLLALFVAGMFDWRRPWSLRNLDVLMLASFTVSLLLFNEGRVFWSVPLAYPPLVYLLGRLLAIGLGRRHRPLYATRWPVWLVAGLAVFALGFRGGLNYWSSNVIDVGYASVVGADRIVEGSSPYGTMPKRTDDHCGKRYSDGSWQAYVQESGACESPVERGDTYGPVMYASYVPMTALLGWSGLWDELDAAHGTAFLFDLLAALGLGVAGLRLGGVRLAAAAVFLWAAFPFTTYALSSNSNDAVIAAFLAWGLALFSFPTVRGFLLGCAALAKFAPLLLIPLWIRADRPASRRPVGVPEEDGPAPSRARRLLHLVRPGPGGLRVVAGLGLSVVVSFGLLVALDGPGAVGTFWDRTFGWQLDRPSPFSIWDWGGYPGFPDLAVPQKVLKLVLVVAAAALYLLPWRLDAVRVAALSGALLVGFHLVLTHWFYLYIPWFVPFAAVALLAPRPSLEETPAPLPVEPDRAPAPVGLEARPVGV